MTEMDFKRLIREYEGELYGYVFNILLDSSVAGDIEQECFMIVWQKLEEIETEAAKTFLFNTAHNLIKKEFAIRKKRKMLAAETIEQTEGYYAASWEDKDYVNALVALLPTDLAQCLMLHTWEGYSYEEIARMLNISLSEVKSNIFRARKRLRELRYKEI